MQKYIQSIASQTTGIPLSGIAVTIQSYPSGTPVTVYATNDFTRPITQPIVTGVDGQFQFYAIDGHYQAIATPPGLPPIITDFIIQDLLDETTFVATALLTASSGSSLVGFQQAGANEVAINTQAKLREHRSVQDAGAVGDNVTNDAVSVGKAITDSVQAGNLLVPTDTYIGTARVANPDGVRFTGAGLIRYVPSAGLGDRVQQPSGRNSAAWGAEYLEEFLLKLVAGTSVTIRGSGDSTMYNLGIQLPFLLASIPLCTFTPITNSGKSTADWVSTYLAADIAAAPDVLIWHWGMNDACRGVGTPTTMAQFESNLRAGLTTYRATVPVLSGGIILMTPSASGDGTNGRDEYRNEKIRQIIRNAAEDFQCAYLDTYSVYQDAYVDIAGGTNWMDNIRVHPQAAFAMAIAGSVYDLLVPSGIQKYIGGFRNSNGLPTSKAATDAMASSYPFGISVWRATSANGWPIDGFVTTMRENSVGTSGWQILHCYNVDKPLYMRTGINSGAWGVWRAIGVPSVAGSNKVIDVSSTVSATIATGIFYTWFESNTASAAFALTLPAPVDGDRVTVVFNSITGVMTFTPTAPATSVTRLPTTAIAARVPFTMIYNSGNTAWYPA
jgi:hypothetical protein